MHRLPTLKRKRILHLLLGQCADKHGVRIYRNLSTRQIRFEGQTEAMRQEFLNHREKVAELLTSHELRKQKEVQRHQKKMREIEREGEQAFWGYAVDNGLYLPKSTTVIPLLTG